MPRQISAFLALMALLAPLAAPAQEAVYLIRHAEKQAGDDPALTEAGRARAARWAVMLGSAGLDLVVTSDAARTRETGGIIAEALGLPVEAVDRTETQELIDLLEWDHEDDRVLVVGHSETLPGILTALGVDGPDEISEDDFANIFLVRPGDSPTVAHLHMP